MWTPYDVACRASDSPRMRFLESVSRALELAPEADGSVSGAYAMPVERMPELPVEVELTDDFTFATAEP